jgi:predicted DNA-binding transcriptional regulator AlpA
MALEEIEPNRIYRRREAEKYFGLRESQIDREIKLGNIPAPMKLTPNGRACGWLGKVILKWQADRLAASQPSRKKVAR